MSSLEPRLGSPDSGVIVTGGASGIGRAVAEALAAVGRPVAIWDIDETRAQATATEIGKTYGVASLALRVDLRDPQAVAPAVIATRQALPKLGGLVHAAGTAEATGLDGVTPENWDEGVNLHVRPLILIAQAMRPDFRANPGSAIVALASINATLGSGLVPIYSAAKGAVISLVRSLADELAADGVRVNAVSPGQVLTPLLQPTVDALPQGYFERRILLGRLGRPDEIARLIRFLLSDEASYITATEILVDGGNVSSTRQ